MKGLFLYVCVQALFSPNFCLSKLQSHVICISLLRKNTEWILIKFAGGNHYHGTTNRLNNYILGKIRTGCDRKFKSMSAGVLPLHQIGADA